MPELNIIEILVTFGVTYLVFYIIFVDLLKNHRLQKLHEQIRETIRVEKSLDLTEAIKRRLYIFNLEKI